MEEPLYAVWLLRPVLRQRVGNEEMLLARRVQVLGPSDSELASQIIFDTQSLQSGSLSRDADKTAAPGDSAKVEKSESMESGEATAKRPSTTRTADESLEDLRASAGVSESEMASAPTSPPTTEENGQATPSEPTTTPCAGCSSKFISDITEELALIHMRAGLLMGRAGVLRQCALEAWRRCCAFTTQAPAAPASEEGKST